MPDYLVISIAICVALAVGFVLAFRLLCKPKAQDLFAADQLRAWTAEQLSDLTPIQREAVELFSWSEKSGWLTVSQNVKLGKGYPNAKEAIDAVQS